MAGAPRGPPGKIGDLLEVIGEHEQAFTYDWRTRFGLPLDAVFDGRMSWRETLLLTMELSADPTSRVGAAVAGWAHPIDRVSLTLMDLFDLTARVNTTRGTPPAYPRPWDTPARRPRRPALTQDRIRAALRARGHNLPDDRTEHRG
jgi:hypothetical protein